METDLLFSSLKSFICVCAHTRVSVCVCVCVCVCVSVLWGACAKVCLGCGSWLFYSVNPGDQAEVISLAAVPLALEPLNDCH